MNQTWSVSRLAIACALGLWAATFWYLISSDSVAYYFSSRTTWLATIGAVILTMAAIGRVASARVQHPEPLKLAHVSTLAALILPALMIIALPPQSLGSFAVSRRSADVKGAYVGSPTGDLSSGDLSLLDVFGLQYRGELHKLVSLAGSTSAFTGFVTTTPTARAGEFQLNRFLISCCPGDAVNVQIRVVGAPPMTLKEDEWVRVTGKLYPVGDDVLLDAQEVERVPRPEKPYLG